MILRKREVEQIKIGFVEKFKKNFRSDLISFLIVITSVIFYEIDILLARMIIAVIILYLFDWFFEVRKKDHQKFDQAIKYCYNESQANDTPNASD